MGLDLTPDTTVIPMETPLKYLEARVPTGESPLILASRLADSGWFDQYVTYEGREEWSFAGGSLATVRLTADSAELTTGGSTRRLPHDTDLATVLEPLLADIPIEDWRAYGWAAFELADPGTAPAGRDLLHLMVPESEVRVLHGEARVRAVHEHQLERLSALVRSAANRGSPPGAAAAAEGDAEDPASRRLDLPVEDSGNYRAAVAETVLEIQNNTLEKAVISRTVPVPEPVDLTASYVAGRRANAPARSFLLSLGGIRAAGFSPELVVQVAEDGRVTTQPLAGTRARTGETHADAALREELRTDPKEVHEHAVSVRLACEELQTCCDRVRVEDFMEVRERGSVQHLASTVRGDLASATSPWAAFEAVFPSVTATGIPKAPACALIHSLEEHERGLYSGAVLTCDSAGCLEATLVLRSLFQQDGRTWLQAGAGIVSHSLPEREHEETCEKLRSVAPYLVPGTGPRSTGAGP